MQCLDNKVLLLAYANGFFPMPHPETEEIFWFNPDPRAIIPLDQFHASRSLKRSIRKMEFKATINQSFKEVMDLCSQRKETWINTEIKTAYTALHESGHAHSLEVRQHGKLVGGVYGVSIGGAFFAESKFHTVTDASKAALFFLTQHLKSAKFELLEVQFMTPHLQSLGAIEIPSEEYMRRLQQAVNISTSFY